jgi:hypothetical protein
MTRIAVIDIGKTNAKLALVEGGTLAEIAVVTRPNRCCPARHGRISIWTGIGISSCTIWPISTPATASTRFRSPRMARLMRAAGPQWRAGRADAGLRTSRPRRSGGGI